jgi:hypothetical protein
MQHTAHTSSLVGLEGVPVTVEAEVMAAGLPALDLAGLQENALREARTRVRAGMEQMGYSFPTKRVQVVISPADLRKTGGYDLAIAVAILTAMGECSPDALPAWMLLGELSLTGVLRGVRGVLSQVQAAKARGFLGVIVPAENAAEAALVSGIVVHSAHTLREVVDFLSRRGELPVASPRVPSELKPDYALDLRDVKGQDGAKRALEIAAHIESRLHLPAREVWDQAHRDLTNGQLCAPGDWLLYTAGARGGIGGFKGAHVHRPSVDGFIPARAALARRLRAFGDPPCRVEVVAGFAEGLVPIPGAVAYLDPPYQGRQGFAGAGGNPLAARLIEMAVRWAAAGCRVGISEALPLDVPGARHVDLTGRRERQTRRSMTRDAQEWLTVVG